MLGAMTLVSCSTEDYIVPDPALIPLASDYADAIDIQIDPETNQVTFSLNATGVMPVWILDGSTYSTRNGLQKIFASAGDYSVEMKVLNANGVSDGSVTKTFHIENTVFDFNKYLTFLAGDGSRLWRIDNDAAGHLGCGPSGTSGLEWWSASANEKADYGLYDNRLSFTSDYQYTYDPGESGMLYANASVTVFPDFPNGADADFTVAVDPQSTTYALEVSGTDLYITFPAHTLFPYIANNDIYNTPRYRVESMTSNKMELVIDNGDIAWHYILTSKEAASAEPEFTGFKYDSEFNLWKAATISDPTFWYAPGWNQIADPSYTRTDTGFTVTLPEATTDQWQAQMQIVTDMTADEAHEYDFSCILITSADHPGITLKLQQDGDDNNFFFADRVATKAYEETVVYYSAMPGIDAPVVKLVLDFGGNEAGTEVEIKNIVFKDHANDDGTVLPAETPEEPDTVDWDEEGETNLWRQATMGEVTFWYAPGWNQIADPSFTAKDWTYTLNFPEATTDQWQAQVHMPTLDMSASADKAYDFRIIINSSESFNGVTIKLQDAEDDNNYFCADRVAVEAYEDYVYKLSNVTGKDMATMKICLDFGGCPANTDIVVSGIIFQEHKEK